MNVDGRLRGAASKLKDEAAVVCITAVLTAVGTTIGYIQARAAVAVRPELADVGFITALLTNHGHDWLFYHTPVVAGVITAVFALFAAVVLVYGVIGL